MEKAEAGREERRPDAAEETLKRKRGTVLDLAASSTSEATATAQLEIGAMIHTGAAVASSR